MIYLPGECLDVNSDELYGHNINLTEEKRSLTLGKLKRINKLVFVESFFKTNFKPAIGDLIVGIVEKIGLNRWYLFINGPTCFLNTSSLNKDATTDFLKIKDIIVCEIQKSGKRSVSVHVHSQNYGKREGVTICLPIFLVKNSWIHENDRKKIKIFIGKNGIILIEGEEKLTNYLFEYFLNCRKKLLIVNEEKIMQMIENF